MTAPRRGEAEGRARPSVMRSLSAIVLDRAEEQLAAIDWHEPTTHDRWQIRSTVGRIGAHYHGSHDPRVRPCLAGDCTRRVTHGGYCAMHWKRVERGTPVDVENWSLTFAEYRRLARGNPRFGGRLKIGGR